MNKCRIEVGNLNVDFEKITDLEGSGYDITMSNNTTSESCSLWFNSENDLISFSEAVNSYIEDKNIKKKGDKQ